MIEPSALHQGGCPAARANCGGDAYLCNLLRRSHFASHLDRRFASSSTTASSPVNRQSGRVRATTDAASASSSRRPGRPISIRRDTTAIGQQMSARDWAVVQSVAQHRFLTVRHIHQLHFYGLSPKSGLRITQRNLVRLRRWRVLGVLERRIGGLHAGSGGLVHYVDAIGAKLLQIDSGEPPKRRYTTPGHTFLTHTLAVAETHIALITAQLHGKLELIRGDVEAAAWRTYHGLGGALMTLRPDLYLETAGSVGAELISSWFFERDMGSESIPTLVRKSREYATYHRTGIEQEQNDGVFPLVIWSLTAYSESRAEERRSALAEAIERDRHLDASLFRIIAPHQLIPLIQKGGDL
ncbi:replication-relaxation family protein [Nocardia brasiliensis]|uniref:replication-relaxation family protein n=1 Tax=Nocardia brasiliensis TaxID=37326 RepID=UPI003D8FC8CF